MLFRSAALAALLSLSGAVHAVVLYDGSLGTSPTTQTPTLGFANVPGGATLTTDATSTTLNTTLSNSIYSGLFTTAVAPLDRTIGYTVRVDAKVLSSSFTNSARAGFSIIALSSDKIGIEIGFHGDEIFSQDGPSFNRGEVVSYDTTAAIVRYDLTLQGSSYTLRANGSPILTGALRDYTPFAGVIDPYETPNFLWFGDDTTSASGSTQFTRLEVNVPEPTTLAAIGLAATVFRRRR